MERARHRTCLKRGGDRSRVELNDLSLDGSDVREDLLALDAALDKLKQVDGTAFELIQLRYFAGLTIPRVAEMLDISCDRPSVVGHLPEHGSGERWKPHPAKSTATARNLLKIHDLRGFSFACCGFRKVFSYNRLSPFLITKRPLSK